MHAPCRRIYYHAPSPLGGSQSSKGAYYPFLLPGSSVLLVFAGILVRVAEQRLRGWIIVYCGLAGGMVFHVGCIGKERE